MESKITDDDLNLSANTNDRLGEQGYGNQRYAGPVRGADGVKAIFNPENRKRLILYAVSIIILVGGLSWVFFSLDEQQAAQGGTGRIHSAGMQTKSNEEPSYVQREEAAHYNDEILPQEQQKDPSAHPLILTEAEESVNPFERKSTLRSPGKISEIGQQEQQVNKTAAGEMPTDYKGMDELIKSLIEHEGSMTPELYSVEWSYRPAAASSNGAAAVETGVSPPEDGGVSNKCANPVTRAATMYMATADIGLNSDVGGPVSLTIRNGKLRGTQLLGSFERKEEWLRMDLNKLVTRDDTLPVTAIGLDMDTTLNAVQGDADRHLLYRYGWWGFGTVLKAIGKAAEMNADSEVVVSDGTVVESTESNSSREVKMALGSLGEDMGGAFQDRINRPITVSLKVNDEVGIFFLDDVCLPSSNGSGY